MSVWVVCPSKRPVALVTSWADAWRDRGYRTAILRDAGDALPPADMVLTRAEYRGYYAAQNELIRQVVQCDRGAQWIIAAADDILPDPNKPAEEIARECSVYFGHKSTARNMVAGLTESSMSFGDTWGVMQPTGDRWGEGVGAFDTAYADRICGSAWLGREFCYRALGGRGPLCEQFTHMFGDEHLQQVALKLGILWQRRDLTHYHDHWGRLRGFLSDMPDFLAEVNSPKHWRTSKAIFHELECGGFVEALEIGPPEE